MVQYGRSHGGGDGVQLGLASLVLDSFCLGKTETEDAMFFFGGAHDVKQRFMMDGVSMRKREIRQRNL